MFHSFFYIYLYIYLYIYIYIYISSTLSIFPPLSLYLLHSLYISARSSIFLSRLHTVHSCGFRSLRKFKINSSSFLSKRRGTLRHPSLWLFVLVMIKEKTIVIQTRRVYFRSFLSNWILTEDHSPSPIILTFMKSRTPVWLGKYLARRSPTAFLFLQQRGGQHSLLPVLINLT